MYKMARFGLTVLAGCVLAACGSSGGSGGSDSHSTTTTTVNGGTTTPVKTPTTTSNEKTGGVLVVSETNGNDVFTLKALTDPSLTQISVDGKVIVLEQPGFYSRGWTTMRSRDTEFYKCCGKYSDVRFGAYEGGQNDNAYFFYNGNPTKSMPQSGSATYTGESIISADDAKFDTYDDYVNGSSTFDVDFGAKTLNGTLNIGGFQPISVEATISNNDFKGTATSTDFSDKASVEGKFYGTNAKELGGIYNGNTWGGAFGASK